MSCVSQNAQSSWGFFFLLTGRQYLPHASCVIGRNAHTYLLLIFVSPTLSSLLASETLIPDLRCSLWP